MISDFSSITLDYAFLREKPFLSVIGGFDARPYDAGKGPHELWQFRVLPEIGRHTIKFCAAWKNKATGFYANYTGVGSKWLNNTSYMNKDREFAMASTLFDSQGNRIAEPKPP